MTNTVDRDTSSWKLPSSSEMSAPLPALAGADWLAAAAAAAAVVAAAAAKQSASARAAAMMLNRASQTGRNGQDGGLPLSALRGCGGAATRLRWPRRARVSAPPVDSRLACAFARPHAFPHRSARAVDAFDLKALLRGAGRDAGPAIAGELLAAAWLWGAERGFSDAQHAVVLGVAREMLAAGALGSAPRDVAALSELARSLLVRHSLHRPPFSVGVLSFAEAAAAASFLSDALLRPLRAYQFALALAIELRITASRGAAEAISTPPPLAEASEVAPASAQPPAQSPAPAAAAAATAPSPASAATAGAAAAAAGAEPRPGSAGADAAGRLREEVAARLAEQRAALEARIAKLEAALAGAA
jgi:hypothetical protein